MHGHQRKHMELRQAVANYIVSHSNCSSVEDRTELRRYAADVMRGGVWVGEDIVLAMARCLQRDIHVYTVIGSSPMIYTPLEKITSGAPVASAAPLRVAFYEPGHYKAVQSLPSPCSTDPGEPLPSMSSSTGN